ncbi:MAG: hypothetical protein MJZ34_02855 [Paludibacteraceae bacterium]|nr:hypothetical protein [Paludibacteraceae bacterium]
MSDEKKIKDEVENRIAADKEAEQVTQKYVDKMKNPTVDQKNAVLYVKKTNAEIKRVSNQMLNNAEEKIREKYRPVIEALANMSIALRSPSLALGKLTDDQLVGIASFAKYSDDHQVDNIKGVPVLKKNDFVSFILQVVYYICSIQTYVQLSALDMKTVSENTGLRMHQIKSWDEVLKAKVNQFELKGFIVATYLFNSNEYDKSNSILNNIRAEYEKAMEILFKTESPFSFTITGTGESDQFSKMLKLIGAVADNETGFSLWERFKGVFKSDNEDDVDDSKARESLIELCESFLLASNKDLQTTGGWGDLDDTIRYFFKNLSKSKDRKERAHVMQDALDKARASIKYWLEEKVEKMLNAVTNSLIRNTSAVRNIAASITMFIRKWSDRGSPTAGSTCLLFAGSLDTIADKYIQFKQIESDIQESKILDDDGKMVVVQLEAAIAEIIHACTNYAGQETANCKILIDEAAKKIKKATGKDIYSFSLRDIN